MLQHDLRIPFHLATHTVEDKTCSLQCRIDLLDGIEVLQLVDIDREVVGTITPGCHPGRILALRQQGLVVGVRDLPRGTGVEKCRCIGQMLGHLIRQLVDDGLRACGELFDLQLADKHLGSIGILVLKVLGVELLRLEHILPLLLVTQRQKVGGQLLQPQFGQVVGTKGNVVVDDGLTAPQQGMHFKGARRHLDVVVPQMTEQGVDILLHLSFL